MKSISNLVVYEFEMDLASFMSNVLTLCALYSIKDGLEMPKPHSNIMDKLYEIRST